MNKFLVLLLVLSFQISQAQEPHFLLPNMPNSADEQTTDEDEEDFDNKSCEELKESFSTNHLLLLNAVLTSFEKDCDEKNELVASVLDAKNPNATKELKNLYSYLEKDKTKKINNTTTEEYFEFYKIAGPQLLALNKLFCETITNSFEVPIKEKMAEIGNNKKNISDLDLTPVFKSIILSLDGFKKDYSQNELVKKNNIKQIRNQSFLDFVVKENTGLFQVLIQNIAKFGTQYYLFQKNYKKCNDNPSYREI
ncbi:MAG: hypothetical protein IPM57_07430 [Oligoflexia bacterium]|nr:hypothetical protein [Oligoflexia bacterium]